MIDSHPKQTVSFEYLKHCVPPVLDAKSAFTIFFSYNQIKNNRKMSHGIKNLAGGTMGGGGGSSIAKVQYLGMCCPQGYTYVNFLV